MITQRPRWIFPAQTVTGWILAACLLNSMTVVRAQEPPAEPESNHHHQDTSTGFHRDFSDAGQWAERFDSPERLEWQKPEEVTRLMEIESGMTVVDIGAGTGYFLSHLSQAAGTAGRVLALDVEESLVHFMAERARREGLGNVEVGHIAPDDPGLENGSVDRILLVNTWHHIGKRSVYSAKLLAALKPGGRVYIVDFTDESLDGPPLEHRLPSDRIVYELQQGGFEAKIISETLPRQFIVVGSR